MTLFRYILPISLALYFIWRARRQRIFLLGIPFLQVMGNSIFFENAKIFWMPGRLGQPLLILLWIFVAWLFIRVEFVASQKNKFTLQNLFGPRLVLPDELFILILVLVWGINSSLAYTQSFVSMQSALDYVTMFLGYLLLRGIFAYTSKKNLLDFLNALIIVNTIANILYILHSGFHLPIYLAENYQEIYLAGAFVIRTFWVAPKFNSLAIVFILSRSKWDAKTIVIFLITLLGYFFTYTRSSIIELVFLVILSQLFLAIKSKKNVKRVFLTISVIALAAVSIPIFLNHYFPQSLTFFSQRLDQLSISGIFTGDNNFTVRMNYLDETFKLVKQVNPTLGIGFIDPETSFRNVYVTEHTADNFFIGVVYRYGIAGVICFLGLFVFTALRTVRAFFRDQTFNGWVCLACFLWIVDLAYSSLFSWTLLDPRNFALSLWMFALIESYYSNIRFLKSSKTSFDYLSSEA